MIRRKVFCPLKIRGDAYAKLLVVLSGNIVCYAGNLLTLTKVFTWKQGMHTYTVPPDCLISAKDYINAAQQDIARLSGEPRWIDVAPVILQEYYFSTGESEKVSSLFESRPEVLEHIRRIAKTLSLERRRQLAYAELENETRNQAWMQSFLQGKAAVV